MCQVLCHGSQVSVRRYLGLGIPTSWDVTGTFCTVARTEDSDNLLVMRQQLGNRGYLELVKKCQVANMREARHPRAAFEQRKLVQFLVHSLLVPGITLVVSDVKVANLRSGYLESSGLKSVGSPNADSMHW
jgi:hypothetical protein